MSTGEINVAPVESLVKNLFGNYGKTLEKFALYVVGILSSVNVIPSDILNKTWTLPSIAVVLAGLHISTPTPKSGPGQL